MTVSIASGHNLKRDRTFLNLNGKRFSTLSDSIKNHEEMVRQEVDGSGEEEGKTGDSKEE